MMATYTTREGEKWDLADMVPHPFLPGFWFGRRAGDGALTCVHEHRLRFDPPEEKPELQAVEAANAS